MSVIMENFLGRDLRIPEDRLYCPEEGLWVKYDRAGKRMAVGMTEPALLMSGGLRDVEILVSTGAEVEAGETVLLALTGKIKYIAAPVSGRIYPASKITGSGENVHDLVLFWVEAGESELDRLTDAAGYALALTDSEGSRNPKGARGGTSPTCKAVYLSIGEQRLPDDDS